MKGKMFKLLTITLVTTLTAASVFSQKEAKPWTEWSEKDVQKILGDSGWSHTQTETDTSEMFFSPTTAGTATVGRSAARRGSISDQQSINNNRADRGATNQEITVNYHIRFFSARPVRQALIRSIELQGSFLPEEIKRLHKYAEYQPANLVIVSITIDSNDQRFLGAAMQAFSSAALATLKNNTYLERSSDGKRLFLQEYTPPGKDGFGARFIFPRVTKDERPFITEQAGEVRFYSEVTDKIKINMRFKVSEMVYQGALEY
jgi:hypothetical protein